LTLNWGLHHDCGMTVLEAARAADARRHVHGQADLLRHAAVTVDTCLSPSGALSGEINSRIEVERMLANVYRLVGA